MYVVYIGNGSANKGPSQRRIDISTQSKEKMVLYFDKLPLGNVKVIPLATFITNLNSYKLSYVSAANAMELLELSHLHGL